MSYYDHFDAVTNHGRVFDTDLSVLDEDLPTTHLTQIEIEERNAWRTRLPLLQAHYEDMDPPSVTTTEILLQQRVLTPNLASHPVSSRSQMKETRKGRRYPATIHPWRQFPDLVRAFQPAVNPLRPRNFDIFNFSSSLTNERMTLSDEKEEETFLITVLKKSLMMANLVNTITTRGGIGKPDALTLRQGVKSDELASPGNIGVISEFKSTHNLPLPMTANGVASAYCKAYQTVIAGERGPRCPPEWARVCHPLGQLLGYLAENGCRYGALSSATRTYFVTIQGYGADALVYISNAFFVGQANFLRAWAYIDSLASQPQDPLVANQLTWKMTSKTLPTPPPRSTYQGSLRSMGSVNEAAEDTDIDSNNLPPTDTTSLTNSGLEDVPIENVTIIRALGYGRNGVVFVADWQGKKVALKQFDVGKDGYEFFDKELAAYAALQDAWGKLVARPLFVSESWSGWIKFIGLQLGRDPRPGDDTSEWRNILATLQRKYGFRHDDADTGNMIFVLDEDTGCERLVAIDLEAHTIANQTTRILT